MNSSTPSTIPSGSKPAHATPESSSPSPEVSEVLSSHGLTSVVYFDQKPFYVSSEMAESLTRERSESERARAASSAKLMQVREEHRRKVQDIRVIVAAGGVITSLLTVFSTALFVGNHVTHVATIRDLRARLNELESQCGSVQKSVPTLESYLEETCPALAGSEFIVISDTVNTVTADEGDVKEAETKKGEL